MATPTKKHLVILVHGIRDFARWQSEVGTALEAGGFIVAHTNFGRMNLLQFLIPIDFFRKRAVERIWTDIQQAKMLNPDADVSIIAHSFGTYVVTRILKAQFALQLYRLILCGCVVRYDFPFEQIQNRFAPPLLNEVGTRDPWPAFAEAVTFGYGSAGTYGFNRPGVTDRYHNGQGHGYFLNGAFAAKYWVPFLDNGTIVPAGTTAESPPAWMQLLSTFKVKWLLVAALLLVIGFFGLRAAYGAPDVTMQVGPGFGFWNSSVSPMLAEVEDECPLPVGCSLPAFTSAITGRRFASLDVIGDPDAVVSCGLFHFPTEGQARNADPVAAIEAVGARYPQCVSVMATADHVTFTLQTSGMTEVNPSRQSLPETMWLCGCEQAQIDDFKARY